MDLGERSRLYPESTPGKACSVTTPLEKTLLVIIAIVVAIGIGLTIAIASVNRANGRNLRNLKNAMENETNICCSASCVSEASNLMKSMDLTVDPCTDFYSFVCGNWIKNALLVSTLESQFTKLTRIIILRAKEILENLSKEMDLPEHKEKVDDFYKACMDKAQRNEIGAEDLLSDLKEFGGWPLIEDNWNPSEFKWVDLMINLFKKGYVNSMLFTVRVDIDTKNTSQSLISISQPSLGLTNKVHYILPSEEMIASYKEVIFKLAKHFKRDLDKETCLSEIEDAFNMENRLVKLMQEVNMRVPEQFYNIYTLKELQIFAPEIPWKTLLRKLLPSDTVLSEQERIMVTDPSMIKGLNNILEELDERGQRVLANYMFYRAVFYAAPHLSREYYLLVNDVFDTDRAGPTRLWEVCVRTTMELFPHSLTASYVNKYINGTTKELLETMVEDLRNSLLHDIKSSEWLDEDTKKYATLKVEKMRKAVAYQDELMDDEMLNNFYKDINITNNHFRNVKEVFAFNSRENKEGLNKVRTRLRWSDITNLLTANAFYYPSQNAIVIPAGVLQDTVFAPDRPNYINYGSLGMVVGHELTHAFDSIGGLYDAEGSYRMWWSEKSWKKFLERTKCYEEQYDKYYVPIADANVNGTLTLSENIADNGGLQTAYHAYNKLLKRIKSEKKLPGLPYNEKQMFWISFASVWCRRQTDDSIQYAMTHSVHTPSQFRVIGSLSNMKEFSEDFHCKLNSTMHPESRCFLWK